jgi:membrane associated rhomboid family serine protease
MASEERSAAEPGKPGVPAPSQCFRHPERDTYLRCSRCERPICTDCMIQAAVGFHCPECVHEDNRTVREVRTVAGGPVHQRQGVVTGSLIAVCVVMFGLQYIAGPAFEARMSLESATLYMQALPHDSQIGVAYGEWYRLVTSIFVHESPLHLLLNMISLWWIGVPVESRLGRTRYFLAFITCGVAGSAASYVSLPPNASSLGASGAIFGLLGILVVLALRERLSLQPLVTVIVLNVVFDVTVPGISWQSHVGGAVAGVILGAAFSYAPRTRAAASWLKNPQNLYPTVAGVGILVLVVLLVLLHSSQLLNQEGTSALTASSWTALLK